MAASELSYEAPINHCVFFLWIMPVLWRNSVSFPSFGPNIKQINQLLFPLKPSEWNEIIRKPCFLMISERAEPQLIFSISLNIGSEIWIWFYSNMTIYPNSVVAHYVKYNIRRYDHKYAQPFHFYAVNLNTKIWVQTFSRHFLMFQFFYEILSFMPMLSSIFYSEFSLYNPWKHPKTSGFLIFLGL